MSAETTSVALRSALNFTLEDLAANRAGELSAAQRERLLKARRRIVLTGAGMLIVVVLAASVALYLAQLNNTPVLALVGVAITIFSAVVSGMLVRNWYRLTSDIDGGTVQTLAGAVEHTVRVTGRVAVYVLKIEDTELTVSKPLFLAVRDGYYRFYRTPAAKALLSVEEAEKKVKQPKSK